MTLGGDEVLVIRVSFIMGIDHHSFGRYVLSVRDVKITFASCLAPKRTTSQSIIKRI